MSIDSARTWTSLEPGFLWYSDPRLLDGTITALVATGDINLIRDQRVKTALITHLGQLEADLLEFRRSVDQFLIHESALLRTFELARTTGTVSGDDALLDELISIQNDKNAAAIFRLLEKNFSSRIWYLEQMLEATEELNVQLKAQNWQGPV